MTQIPEVSDIILSTSSETPTKGRDENRFEGVNDFSMNSSDLDTDKGHLRNIIL
jgi:hypothetical protein